MVVVVVVDGGADADADADGDADGGDVVVAAVAQALENAWARVEVEASVLPLLPLPPSLVHVLDTPHWL